VDDVMKRMLAAAVVEQAVVDIRISEQHKLINPNTLHAKHNLPKRLPNLLDKEDLTSLRTFITRDLDVFIEATGLRLSADAIRRGIKTNKGKAFKRFCSESAIQTYERRWKPNPLQEQPAPRRQRRQVRPGGKMKN